jgi:UDP-N-acetylmuramoyl-tripeptide--D-alanyl-D-alanine ligase
MIKLFSMILIYLSVGYFGYRRMLRYFRYLQQEGYDSTRFCRWIYAFKAWDRKASLVAIIASCLSFIYIEPVVCLFATFSLFAIALLETDPRVHGKVKLIMTTRAKRIFRLAISSYLVMLALVAFKGYVNEVSASWWLLHIALFQFIPIWLVFACFLLKKSETRYQSRLQHAAHQILVECNPLIIGITGSYGKTSVKYILARLIQTTLGPTFWTPKSINTAMGITREIRTRLVKGIDYAIFEMGAYYPGSIKKLCNLTPPRAAIITGVGIAHLERFKSQQAIQSTKAELAHALPEDGILVCNGDNEGSRAIADEVSRNKPNTKVILYGLETSGGYPDCHIHSWKGSSEGVSFILDWQGISYRASTPLFGRAVLSNIAAAFTMTCALGADPEFVLATIAGLEPISNRLQVETIDNRIYIKDAYNSNPEGFRAALEVLKNLEGRKRFLMTPGMIELGYEQDIQNEKLASEAAAVCDYILIVGSINRKAILKGLQSQLYPQDQIIFCDTREIAFEKLAGLTCEQDLILIENDLTDLFEKIKGF